MLDMEKNDEQITVPFLTEKMSELSKAKSRDGYSKIYLKKRIEEGFQGQVVITNVYGNPDVITFRSTASKLLLDFQKSHVSENVEIEKMKIIKTAANMIKNAIKELKCNMNNYPTNDEIKRSLDVESSSFCPTSLLHLLIASISQAIIQNSRPRSIITLILIALAVVLHRHFELRYLIDILHAFGFCASYSEVIKFESLYS